MKSPIVLYFIVLIVMFITQSVQSTPQQILIEPGSEFIAYTGRYLPIDMYYSFDWSGVSISFQITGTTSVYAIFSTSIATTTDFNMFNVIINGAFYPTLNVTSTDPNTYDLLGQGVSLDPTKTYTIVLTKRTEAAVGVVNFYGLQVDTSSEFTPYELPTRKLEFIGDSITCGYGDEGNAPCVFSVETENNYVTYEGIISRELKAQFNVVAWSGKGVVRNYASPNTTSSNTLPTYYDLSVANNQSSQWSFDLYTPDAVIINLGTNDYSTEPTPPQDIFQQGYIDFIAHIREEYSYGGTATPPPLFLVCGPMISGACCTYVQNVANHVNATYIDLQNILQPDEIGCAGHPNSDGHLSMATIAYPIIQKNLGWS